MRSREVAMRRLGPPQLRALLLLSRDLLQSDQARGSLDLVGKCLAELIEPDSALLAIRGEVTDVVEFDQRGLPHPADQAHPLYQACMDVLAGTRACAGGQAQEKKLPQHSGSRTLALGVPADSAIAAIAVRWERELNAVELGERKRTLTHIAELAVAALGKIQARNSLERIVWDQREELANTAEAHAAELARRDELETEMRVLSLTDVLTGLHNRRGFFVQAEQIFKVAQRKHAKSAVIFADINGLKHVNDELGHDAGDSLIRDAGSVFRQSFRQADVVARLGGDEFVAYTLDDERPDVILARICANLRAFNMMQERPYGVSISVGVVQCDPNSDQTLLDYVLLADEKMYANKRGRLH